MSRFRISYLIILAGAGLYDGSQLSVPGPGVL